MAPAGQERDGTGAAGTEPTSRGPRPDVLAVGRSPSWLRRGGRGPVSGSWGRSARPGTTPQGRSGVSRAGFEPAQGWLKASCPTALGDRLIGPHPIRTGTSTSQASDAARLHQGPGGPFRGRAAPLFATGDRRLGGALTTGGRGPWPSGSSGASAIGAGSRGSASSGIRSPPFSLVRNRGRASRTPTARSTVSNAALTPCPANLPSRRTRRASALNTLGSPPRAVSDSASWRCGAWRSEPRRAGLFQRVVMGRTTRSAGCGLPLAC